VGDAVEVSYAQEIAEVNPLPVKGTVMSMSRKGIDAKFTLINSMDDEWFTTTYTTSSPLLRGLEILQKNRVTDGVRRARRAKLTYLKEADPVSSLIFFSLYVATSLLTFLSNHTTESLPRGLKHLIQWT